MTSRRHIPAGDRPPCSDWVSVPRRSLACVLPQLPYGMLRNLALLVLVLLAGCALPVRQPPVPRVETEQATVLGGLPNARFWADAQVPEMAQEALRALERERQHLGLTGPAD